jgi:uncharacterized protein (UPF0335 family)
MTKIGDNSGAVAVGELKQFVERIERLDDDISLLREDMKGVFSEAKGRGYDTKALRKIVALRKKDLAKLKEEQALLDIYAAALGMEGVFA